MFGRLSTIGAFLSLFLLAPFAAWACGGFFCNAGTLAPIYQAGERIVFARDNDSTVMHVEIMYQGEPTDFGWLLPLPVVPTDEENVMKPLEEVLSLSTARLFAAIQQATNPQFRIVNSFDDNDCSDQVLQRSPGPVGQFDAASSFDGGDPPPVAVLQEANVGPFGAQLIKATSTDALYTWLEEEGYVQDEAAKPILKNYIDKDYVFLGLKLLSGKESGDIVPVELHLGDTDSCIPLTLTSIAATDNMPILVWVLGEHRAIPKNFLHALVNPRALTWPGAGNYTAVVNEAVDSAAGHAFLTEYASDEKLFDGFFWGSAMQSHPETIEKAETLKDMLVTIQSWEGSNDSELTQIITSHIKKPEGLKGYPYGDCFYGQEGGYYYDYEFGYEEGWSPCVENEEHETSDAEFYSYLGFWVENLKDTQTEIEVDMEGLKAGLKEGYYGPRE